MPSFTRAQKILARWIVVLLVFGFGLLALRNNLIADEGYSLFTYLQYGLFENPVSAIGQAYDRLANLWHVYEDNVYLNRQLANQRTYETLWLEEHQKLLELEKLAEIRNSMSETYLCGAQVLLRSAQSWNQRCTISAGADQGVEENMLVISSQGAIGFIEEVQSSTSTVILLSSNERSNDLAIQIVLGDGSAQEGILNGYDAASGLYEVILFDENAAVLPGALVSTSGKGGNYPSGIFVGTVDHVTGSEETIVSIVYVSPVSNFNGFDYVGVLGKAASGSQEMPLIESEQKTDEELTQDDEETDESVESGEPE